MTRRRTTREYRVTGMTCEHCRLSVLEEVGELDGVESVEVDLATGRLEVSGTAGAETVRAAVEEAGYALAAGE